MALIIDFEGFVQEVKTFDWGNVAKIAHSQRAKNKATGEWETTGKDFLDVVLPAGVMVSKDDRVSVRGSLKVGTFAKQDGSIGISFKVNASNVERVQRTSAQDRFSPTTRSEDVF